MWENCQSISPFPSSWRKMERRLNTIALDSCSLLNLYASGRFQAIVGAVARPFVVAERVHAEALYIRRGGTGEDADEREQVDCPALIASGALALATLSPTETATFVMFAAEVDDGEAATAALALHRGYDVATDDGKALRLLHSHVPAARCYSTLELLKHWSDTAGVQRDVLREALVAARERGNFLWPKRDPLRAWAEAIMS